MQLLLQEEKTAIECWEDSRDDDKQRVAELVSVWMSVMLSEWLNESMIECESGWEGDYSAG